MLGTSVSALYVLTHLNLTISPRDGNYHNPHFMEKEKESKASK